MMEESRNEVSSAIVENIDSYSILRDMLRNLWVAVLGAAAVAMIVNIVVSANYESTYTTTATFVVSSQNADTNVYGNLNAAQTMAENFSNILNSDILKKKVCQDLGMDEFDATTSSAAIENTNLLTLTVTADTPKKAYNVIRSIMKNYTDLTQYVTGSMIMQVLQEPVVPTGVDVAFNANQQTQRWFIYSLLFFIFCFAVLSYLKKTIKTQRDMEEMLAANALGMIYYERKGLFKKKGSGLMVNHVSASFEFVERFKKVTTMITNAAKKNNAKSIVFTSVEDHEGTSLVAANVALSLAKQNYRVVLIDADLRHPSLMKMLDKKIPSGKGIADFLQGNATLEQAMVYDEKDHIYLMLGDKGYRNSTELISGPMLGRLLEALKKEVDYIVIDTPSMSSMADAEAATNVADMSVLVVGYDRVLADNLNDAIDALQDSCPNMAGCILNQVKTLPGTRRATGGYGGYGRYGHYGHYGHYGRYGQYGRYGAYGHYSHVKDSGKQSSQRTDTRGDVNISGIQLEDAPVSRATTRKPAELQETLGGGDLHTETPAKTPVTKTAAKPVRKAAAKPTVKTAPKPAAKPAPKAPAAKASAPEDQIPAAQMRTYSVSDDTEDLSDLLDMSIVNRGSAGLLSSADLADVQDLLDMDDFNGSEE